MPARRRSFSGSRSRRPHRKLIWAQRTASVAFTANNQWTNIDLLQEYKAATGASSVGVTVMRTHLWVLPLALAAGDTWWVGVHVDDLDQVVTATTNALVSNPHDNPYVDWSYARKFQTDLAGFSGCPGVTWGGAVIDLKAKRRMEEVQEAYLLNLYQDTVGTVAKTWNIHARTLLALP